VKIQQYILKDILNAHIGKPHTIRLLRSKTREVSSNQAEIIYLFVGNTIKIK
jgi:hypothetical protein